MFQICGCGAQPGYAHLPLCPFPYYGNDPKQIDKWTAQYIANEKAAEQSVHADVCHECGETETVDPNNDGVPVCVRCGTRR